MRVADFCQQHPGLHGGDVADNRFNNLAEEGSIHLARTGYFPDDPEPGLPATFDSQ